MLRFHLLQISSRVGDIEHNLNKLFNFIHKLAHKDGLDVFITPELYLHGYTIKDLVHQLAISRNSKYIREVVDICREYKCHVVLGLAELDEKTKLIYNSAFITLILELITPI